MRVRNEKKSHTSPSPSVMLVSKQIKFSREAWHLRMLLVLSYLSGLYWPALQNFLKNRKQLVCVNCFEY